MRSKGSLLMKEFIRTWCVSRRCLRLLRELFLLLTFTVVLYGMSLSTAPDAQADMPARMDVFVQASDLREEISRILSGKHAAILGNFLQEQRPLERAYPYPAQEGSMFAGSSGAYLNMVRELVNPYLAAGKDEKVRNLFSVMNRKQLVQGISESRTFSGCAVVRHELVEHSQHFQLKALFFPLSRNGCETASDKNKPFLTIAMESGIPVAVASRLGNQHFVYVQDGSLRIGNASGTGEKLTSSGIDAAPAVSPDGETIVFHREWNDPTGFGALMLLSRGGSGAREVVLKGMSGGQDPSFSSDGRQIVFVGMSDLKKRGRKNEEMLFATMSVSVMDIATRQVRHVIRSHDALLDAGYVYAHPSFSPDGQRIVYQHSGSDVSGGFSIVDLKGETLFHYPKSRSDATPYWRPQFSADGRQILCYSPATSEGQKDMIWLVDIASGDKQPVTEGSNPVFTEKGTAVHAQ